jgi:hypothetical protein
MLGLGGLSSLAVSARRRAILVYATGFLGEPWMRSFPYLTGYV